MAVDGSRALLMGSYITPSSGEHSGRLGPWASVVRALGLNPEATGVKVAFLVFGLVWLIAATGFVLTASWAWTMMLIVALATLWYLIPGTVISALVLILLWLPPVRGSF